MERQIPPQYRAMRKLARSHALSQESEAKIFYEQAKFMEDFEDDFDFQGRFFRYFPTYQLMDDQQLRGYFSWRTRVRRGLIERTSLSFAFVYIYELLNQIGAGSPEDGFQRLKDFWLVYKDIDDQIDNYVRMWLKDYVVYHNLDQAWLDDLYEADFDRAVLSLLDYKSRDVEEVFGALNSLSSYNLENSRFFKKHPDEVKTIVYEVFALFSDYYGKNRKSALCEKFFGKVYASPYTMFKSAVFYNRGHRDDFVYEINAIHKYSRQNGNWICQRFFRYGDKSRQIGDLLKTIDFMMRRHYNFKSTLKPGRTTKILEGIVNKALSEHQARQQQAARTEIEIDVSKLQDIRDTALEIQGKLIIDASTDSGSPELSAPKEYLFVAENGSGPGGSAESDLFSPPTLEKTEPDHKAGLSDDEYRFLIRLLYGREDDETLQSRGLILSVLIDAINEKLFESFGDSVIIEVDGRPELVEDYIDELKEMIKA